MLHQRLQTQSPTKDAYLVRSKAVMQLDDADLVSPCSTVQARLGEHLVRSILRHAVAHDLHRALALEGDRFVGCQCLGYDLDRLVLQAMLADKLLGGDNVARSSVLVAVSPMNGVTYGCRDVRK